MANQLITNQIIAKLAMKRLKNNLILARTTDRQWQNVFDNQTGRTIKIREPVRLLPTPGRVINPQNIEQRYRELTVDQRWHVAVPITDEEMTLELNSVEESVIKPAMESLANCIDASLYARLVDLNDYVGTAGTPPSAYATISAARAHLNSFGVPLEDRYLITSEKDGDSLRVGMTGYFDEKFVDPILRESSMGRIAGFSAYSAQNVQQPIMQTVGGTARVNGVNQTGNALIIDGVTANQVFTKGTVFEIAGINSVNAISKNNTQYTAKFVVTDTIAANGSGQVTLPIYPAIEPIGPYQNVTTGPADNALITFQGTHTINVAYNKQVLTLAMINLYAPVKGEGVYTENVVDKSSNLALRMTRFFDGRNMTDTIRFDALWGVASFPIFGTRVMGS